MPFGESHNNFYDNYVEKAIINSNYFAHRIDRTDKAGNIPALFHTSLEIAKSVIVDITGYNANVMYELGHVHAKNIKPLIILRNIVEKQSEINDLPFYLKQEMILKVNDNEEGYKKIKLAIENFLGLARSPTL